MHQKKSIAKLHLIYWINESILQKEQIMVSWKAFKTCYSVAILYVSISIILLIHSFIHSFFLSLIDPFTHSFFHWFIHSFVRSFIHYFSHSFIRSKPVQSILQCVQSWTLTKLQYTVFRLRKSFYRIKLFKKGILNLRLQ